MDNLQLPPLTTTDIEKFDELLDYLKENKNGFINTATFCEQKWGDNYQLYYSFSHHLKVNGLTHVQNVNGQEYIWGQMISQRGLSLDSFKNEYERQAKVKQQVDKDKNVERLKNKSDIWRNVFYVASVILPVSVFINIYQLYNDNKNEQKLKQQEQTIDSLLHHKAHTDSINTTVQADTAKHIDKISTADKFSFKNITEVIQDKKSRPWVNINRYNSSASLSLHFNLVTTDTLEIAYSSECWLYFPYKVSSDKIEVYWDKIIDTKYDFDIVKAINKTEDKYNGKPFMTLQLINDTTLKATYLLPQLIKKINSSAKDRLFFPDKFFVSKTYFP